MKYDLVGQNGNVYNLISYTAQAMISERFPTDKIAEIQKEAMSGDYDNAICVLDKAIQLCNNHASESSTT
jgi:hypothetical protein